MNPFIAAMKERVRAREQRQYRQAQAPDVLAECQMLGLSDMRRAARLVRRMCESEQAIILPDENIPFTRTLPEIPLIYSRQEWERLTENRVLHELGPISNICPDWGFVLSRGLDARGRVAQDALVKHSEDPQAVEFLESALETIDAVLGLAQKYARAASILHRTELEHIYRQVPARPPVTFQEALIFLRLVHAVVWLGGHYHVGLGRFDQYMFPYLSADLAAGRINLEESEELLAEFFIGLNKDSDLYPGVQQGDNGQTMTLGGVRPDGSDGVNELTWMALRVGRDLSLIDPKINLRINSNTDLKLLQLATELTRKGLGFPQYSNDDVVIPGLLAHGYELEDARDYTVAACWEFIIPGKGMEIVNIGAVSFPAAVDTAVRSGLKQGRSFNHILQGVQADIQRQVDVLTDAYRQIYLPPAPFYSVLFEGCLENGRDLSRGLKYNNFGIHGACSANAADALAAVQSLVFEEHSLDPQELLSALDNDFSGGQELLTCLLDAPKVGKNSQQADDLLVWLFNGLAEACQVHQDNGRGGIIRPGSGSAMYYIWLAQGHEGMREPVVGATADGRSRGEPFSANLAPSPGVLADGPLSVFRSFAQIDYQKICNGGPITIELSDTVFRNPEAINKVAMLIRTFARMGGQQLQLNSLNAETLLEARKHPEQYKNLIVRVWGWSGYFCELAPEYQDHVINRALYGNL